MAFELTADEKVSESLLRCLRQQLGRAWQELASTAEDQDDTASAVHAARKAIKKQRAILRLARGSLPAGERKTIDRHLRAAGRHLSQTRDRDVLMQTFDEIFFGPSAQPLVREWLALEIASTPVSSSTAVAEGRKELNAVGAAATGLRLKRQGWDAIEPGLDRTYRDGRKALRQVRREPTLQHLHEWRKRVKDLWYDLRLLAPVSGPAVGGLAAQAGALGELLGLDHDLGLLRESLVAIGPKADAELAPLLAAIDGRRGALQERALAAGAALYLDRPGAFCERLHRSWKAGLTDARHGGRPLPSVPAVPATPARAAAPASAEARAPAGSADSPA